MKDLTNRLTSRKFLYPIIFALFVWANKQFELGFTEDNITSLATLILGFIAAEGVTDTVQTIRDPNPQPRDPEINETNKYYETDPRANDT